MTPTSAATTVDWADRIGDAIDGRGLRSVFQPIVDLQRRTVVGYEALTRFDPIDGTFVGPDVWFQAAHAAGLGSALDAAAVSSALSARADLPTNCFLTVNVDPESLVERQVLEVFARHGHLGGVVIEITEHRPWDWASLSPVVARLRSAGALFAVDDAGAGYSGLQQILQLRPSLLKLDRALVEGIDTDEPKQALVEMLGLFANRVDAWILAEGVETIGEARALIDLEVPLAQGYYFARPEPPWAAIDPASVLDLADFVDANRATLHRLVDPVAALRQGEDVALGWSSRSDPWVPVIDQHRRPLGLVDAEAALSGELVRGLVANVHSDPNELAGRLVTSAHDIATPVMVTDNAGRYLGLITTRRLIGALVTSPD
ncbi:MAG: EAL domain-containing protein [Acidimicrobiales bacterium]